MLVIRTGKPGHGKTLNTIKEVDRQAFAQSRPVYYHNINGLKPELLKASWFEFQDPEHWFDLPDNSIIVIDEAQTWFGTRDPRTRPPFHITRFETMRHNGFEVHLVTQDPRYIDVHLRRLCNAHIHYWRVFKSSRLLRFESETVIEKVENIASFKDADKQRIKIDSSIFDVYKSSNANHHFKTKVPKKMIFAVCVIFAAVFLAFRLVDRITSAQEQPISEPSEPSKSTSLAPAALVSNFVSSSASDTEKPLTTAEYLALRVPRIPDDPASAPIYDELTKPVTYPKLSCVLSTDPGYIERNRRRYRVVSSGASSAICECYTQQGTHYKTSFSFCTAAVERGYFDPAKPDPGTRKADAFGEPASQSARASRPVPSLSPSFPSPSPSSAPADFRFVGIKNTRGSIQ